MIVISDTTPIIALMKANQLELLQRLFDVVYIPEAVYKELTEFNNSHYGYISQFTIDNIYKS